MNWSGEVRTLAGQGVCKAHVEGRVGVRGEGIAVLTVNVLGPAVVVAHSIADLDIARQPSHSTAPPYSPPINNCNCSASQSKLRITHMHVELLPISTEPINNGRNNHKLVLGYEVPYAPLVSGRIVRLNGMDIEFKRRSKRENEKQQECAQKAR